MDAVRQNHPRQLRSALQEQQETNATHNCSARSQRDWSESRTDSMSPSQRMPNSLCSMIDRSMQQKPIVAMHSSSAGSLRNDAVAATSRHLTVDAWSAESLPSASRPHSPLLLSRGHSRSIGGADTAAAASSAATHAAGETIAASARPADAHRRNASGSDDEWMQRGRRGDEDEESDGDEEARLQQLQRIFRTPQHSRTKRAAVHSRDPSSSMLLLPPPPSPMLMRSRSGGIPAPAAAASPASAALDAEWSSANIVSLSNRIHAAHSARHSMTAPSLDVSAAQSRGLRPHEALRALMQVDAYLAHYSAFVQSEIQRQPMGEEIASIDFQLEADDAVVAATTALLDQAASEKIAAICTQQQQQQPAAAIVAFSPLKHSSTQPIVAAAALLPARPALAAASSPQLMHAPVPANVLELQPGHAQRVAPAASAAVVQSRKRSQPHSTAGAAILLSDSSPSASDANQPTKSAVFAGRVLEVLQRFFVLHSAHPFPTEDQREELAAACAMSPQQVANWFDNARKRRWKPFCAKLQRDGCVLATQPMGQCVCPPATAMGRVPVHAWTDMFRQKLQAVVPQLPAMPTAAHSIPPLPLLSSNSHMQPPQVAMQQFIARNQFAAAAAAAAAAASSLPPLLAASFFGLNQHFAPPAPVFQPMASQLLPASPALSVPATVVAGSKRRRVVTESKCDDSDDEAGAAIRRQEEQTNREKRSKIPESSSGAAPLSAAQFPAAAAAAAAAAGSVPRRAVSAVLPKPPPIPARSLRILRDYFLAHIALPFPTESQKLELVASCSLSLQQVTNWFENVRKRSWKPFCAQLQQVGCVLATNPMATCDCNNRTAAVRGMIAAPGPALHVWSDMWLGATALQPAVSVVPHPSPLVSMPFPHSPPPLAAPAAFVPSNSAARSAVPIAASNAAAAADTGEPEHSSNSDDDQGSHQDRTSSSDDDDGTSVAAAPVALASSAPSVALSTARRCHRAKSSAASAAAPSSSRSKLSLAALSSLRSYFLLHIAHPFPSERDRRALAVLAGDIPVSQVTAWFVRARKHQWTPYKEHLHKVGCAIVTQTNGSKPPVCACRPESASAVAVSAALSTAGSVRAQQVSAARSALFAPPHSWIRMWGTQA